MSFRELFRKAMPIALTTVIICGGVIAFSANVHAAEGSQDNGIQEIMEQSAVETDAFAAEDGKLVFSSGSKPASFDLRNVDGNCYITPVRQQNPFGTCWGFGTIAAAESSILSSGLAAEQGDTADTLDLSEKQLAWFVTQSITDKNDPQYGEGLQFRSSVSDKARYNLGGFTVYATNLFASGAGPVEERTTTDDGQIFQYRGKDGIVLSRSVTWLDEGGNELTGVKKVFYSDDDDWSIPDQYRFSQSYRLKESYLLPTPSVAEEDGGVKVYNEEATNAIKEQLLSNHAVCISFRADHSRPGEETSQGGYMSDNWSQCILADDTSPNHVVTIVGYDDDYPKELFREDSQPPEDGAWLVKNSWGSDLNVFPNNGYSHWGLLEGQDAVGYEGNSPAVSGQHTGYFWLSYYDKSIENPESYSFEAAPEECSIQQHDYMPVNKYQTYSTETTSRMANVFTASENGKIEDVSFLTTTPGTTVTFKIYLLTADEDGPEGGECVYESAPKTYAWGGYHKETLASDANVIVATGQKYSVVVEETTPSGKYSISFGRSPEENYGNCAFHAVLNEGESFLYLDDKWNDLSNSEIQDVLNSGTEGTEMDNFPIKVYLSPVENGGVYLSVNGLDPYGEEYNSIKIDQQIQYEAFFKGGTDDPPTAPVVTWEASDPDIFSIEITDNDNCKAVVTGKQDGTAYLIVDAGIYGKKIIKIKVNKYSVIGFELAEGSEFLPYTGEPIEPEVTTVWMETVGIDGTTDVVKDVDYTVSYEDNILCGMAKVIVKGIGTYKGESERSFMIVPRQAVIEDIAPGENSLAVNFRSQKKSGIDGYVLSCSDVSSGEVKTVEIDSDSTSATVTGLEEGKNYSVTLKAYVNNPNTDPYWDVDQQDWVDPPTRYFGQESDVVTAAVKMANPLSVKGKTVKVKYADLKKKAKKLAVSKVIRFKKTGEGTMTYIKESGNKKITINKKTGKVTVKKRLKKGTYKVKVNVTAAGDEKYASGSKTVTITVKVK